MRLRKPQLVLWGWRPGDWQLVKRRPVRLSPEARRFIENSRVLARAGVTVEEAHRNMRENLRRMGAIR